MMEIFGEKKRNEHPKILLKPLIISVMITEDIHKMHIKFKKKSKELTVDHKK